MDERCKPCRCIHGLDRQINSIGEVVIFCDLTDQWMNVTLGYCVGNCEAEEKCGDGEIEPEPCPFCGCKATALQIPDTKLWTVGCDDDMMCWGNINHVAMVFVSKENAIEAWNRRADNGNET